MWKNLSLADDECMEWEAPAGECRDMVSRGQTCVIRKLFADHIVSKETIKNTLLRWWKLSETISFKILGENLFLVEFIDEDDKRRVLEGRPWVF
jgi:preprotein translocase subunit Sec63